MRKLSSYILLLGLFGLITGCGSTESDETNDEDVFVGTWSISGISDTSGDRTATFLEGFTSVAIGFEKDGGFSLVVDAVINEGDASYQGEYGIVESNSTVSVSINVSGQALPLAFAYEIVDDTHIKLTAYGTTSALLGNLFSTSLTPPVIISLVKG